MRNLVSRWCAMALLLVPLVTSTAWAQTFTGGLRGAVRDANGVIPGVTVTLNNDATGATRDAVSNEQGEYSWEWVLEPIDQHHIVDGELPQHSARSDPL